MSVPNNKTTVKGLLMKDSSLSQVKIYATFQIKVFAVSRASKNYNKFSTSMEI